MAGGRDDSRKRARTGPGQNAEQGQSSRDTTGPRYPWPEHEEGQVIVDPIDCWYEEGEKLLNSSTFLERPFTEKWDAFDSTLYNAWLKVEILPTRFIHPATLDDLGLRTPVEQCIEACGLGHMPTTEHDLYRDLVRQFMASVRVKYSDDSVFHKASEGSLVCKLGGIRHTISFRDLCDVYGFDREPEGCQLPIAPQASKALWHLVTGKVYNAKESVQASIRHPVLRILAKVITNTILCKAEANKMRVEELTFLHFAVGQHLQHLYPPGSIIPDRSAVNMGAVFAHHLIELQAKPFQGKKPELVGSLLIPLFRRFGAITSAYTCDTSRTTMNATNLRLTKIAFKNRKVRFCMRGYEWALTLPAPDLTAVDSDDAVRFMPPEDRLTRLQRLPQADDDEEDESEGEPDAGIPEFELRADEPHVPEEWPAMEFPPEIQEFAPSPPPATLSAGERHIIREQRKQSAFLLRMWERITCRGSTSADASSPRRHRSRSPRQP